MRKGIFRLIEEKTNDIDSMIVIIKLHYEFIFLFVLNNTVSWKVFTIFRNTNKYDAILLLNKII